jgi:hypothetical protein
MTRAKNEPEVQKRLDPRLWGQRANAIAEGIIGAVIMEPPVKSHGAAFDGNSRKY